MAERLNFTKASLEAIVSHHDGTRRTIHDAKQAGLVADLRGAGVLTFYLYKWIAGHPQRIRLGRFPETTIDQARTQTIKLLGKIANGENPATERRAARVEHTFGALFDHWLENHAKLHRRTWGADERQFNKHLAHWRTRRLSSFSRSEIQSLHSRIGRDRGKFTANRTVELIRALFNKADSIGYRGDNPAAKVQRFHEQSRDRFLRPEELPAFWNSLEAEQPLYRDFFMLALLTGARRRNLQGMRWEDVHLESSVWRIPHSKNDEPVLIHLPSKAAEILRRRQAENDSPWVFPAFSASGHLESPGKIWKRILKRARLKDLRIHDLRRTLGSWQAIAGSSLPIIGKSLGHKSLQSSQIYARLTMEPVAASVDAATDAILAAAKRPRKSQKYER